MDDGGEDSDGSYGDDARRRRATLETARQTSAMTSRSTMNEPKSKKNMMRTLIEGPRDTEDLPVPPPQGPIS